MPKENCEGGSNENFKYILSRNLLNAKGTQWLHFSMQYRTATCRPVFKPWVSLLKVARQSSCGSNFYRTFKVFSWLSLVHKNICSVNIREGFYLWISGMVICWSEARSGNPQIFLGRCSKSFHWCVYMYVCVCVCVCIYIYIYIQSGPKKCIHFLLINIFGINFNEISISGWDCNIMFSQQMAQALL